MTAAACVIRGFLFEGPGVRHSIAPSIVRTGLRRSEHREWGFVPAFESIRAGLGRCAR
jgi:hypothetical protein